MALQDFTDQQSRIDRSFARGGTCCDIYCEACGRTYFVTSAGHGDYEEGEIEALREKAQREPDKYIEVPDYSSVSAMHWNGKEVVIGCLCDPTRSLATFIEKHAEQLTEYLRLYWKDMHEKAASELKRADDALAALGWNPMRTAPKNATWIEVETKDGQICQAHWASDLSGEEQPPFEGWYVEPKPGYSYRQVQPIQWRPLKT